MAELLDHPEPGLPAAILAARMAELFQADVVTIVDVDMVSGRGRRLGYVPDAIADRLPEPVPDFLARHPQMDFYFQTRSAEPLRVSDTVSLAEWRRSPVYGLFAGEWGVRHQLTIPWSAHLRCWRGVGIFRNGGDFSVAARKTARLLQPFLVGLQALRAEAAAGPARAAVGLTRREEEVLGMLYEGLTVAAIARRLGISPRTAGHHVEAVHTKLEVRDRVNAVRRGQRLGILPPP